MLLYHVTSDLNHNGVFIPRIPENVEIYDEDETTPRICVSNSIEGCLTSMPNGGDDLSNLLEYCDNKLKVFVFDTNKLGINDENIINSKLLVDKYRVHDAILTGEHWLLNPVSLTESSIINITSFDTELITMEYGYTIGKIHNLKYTTHHNW